MITYLARFSLILMLAFSFSFLFVQQRKELITLSHRTKTADHILQNQRFEYLSSILTEEHKKNPGKEISVYYSPQLFRFENTGFSVEMIYGPFVNWDEGRSYVILCDLNNPKTQIPNSVTGAEYEQSKQALAEYDKHVGYRASSPAYIKLPQKIDGLFVFKRIR